jgi:hypothetical protein
MDSSWLRRWLLHHTVRTWPTLAVLTQQETSVLNVKYCIAETNLQRMRRSVHSDGRQVNMMQFLAHRINERELQKPSYAQRSGAESVLETSLPGS